MSNDNKNTNFVEGNVVNSPAKFQLRPLIAYEEMIFEYVFCKFSLSVAMATNQIERIGQNNTFGRGLLKKLFFKYNNKIGINFPIIIQWKL